MAWEFTANSFTWTPGRAGKGYMLQDGTIHTWPIDADEAPHHIDYYQTMGGSSPLSFLFDISPTGGINDGGKGFSNTTGKSPESIINHLCLNSPHLKDGRHEFDSDLLDVPSYDGPIGRDQGFGHIYKFMSTDSLAFEHMQGPRLASVYDELADWLGSFESAPAAPTAHHESLDDLIPTHEGSPTGAQLYPPGHEPKIADAQHKLWWEPGVYGRGFVLPDSSVHTWPESEGSHMQSAAVKGIPWDHVRQRSFIIRPDGTSFFPYTYPAQPGDEENLGNIISQVDSRLKPHTMNEVYPPSHESKTERDELHVALEVPDDIAEEIREWVDNQTWPTGTELTPKSDYHITLLYAPEGHEEHSDAKWLNHTDGYDVKIVALDEFKGDGEDNVAIVLRLESPDAQTHADDLQDQAEIRELEISRFPGGYKPHITVAYAPHKPAYARAPKLDFKSGPSHVSPPRESSVKQSMVVSQPHHYNAYTGLPCACPYSKPGRMRRMAHIHEAGQQLNKLLKSNDKRLQSPEGKQFLETLQNGYERYDALLPWLAQRWKKGDIRVGEAPNRQLGQPTPPRPLEANGYQSHGTEYERPHHWQSIDHQINRWHQWFQAKQHPTRRGVNVMDPNFGVDQMSQKVRAHEADLIEQEQRKEALAHGKTVHRFDNGWSIKHLNAPTNDQGEYNDTESAMEVEGRLMDHCIGNDEQPYKQCALDGSIEAYSLRDPKGLPHVTWHHNSDGSLAEMFGRSDSLIKPEYQDMLDEYDPELQKENEVGHNEHAYDTDVTIPAAESIPEYLAYQDGDYEYPEDSNLGEDTEVHFEEPDWDTLAEDFHSPELEDHFRKQFMNYLIQNGHRDNHLNGFREAMDNYAPINDYGSPRPLEPHEQQAQQVYQQTLQPHYHPMTGEFVQPRWNPDYNKGDFEPINNLYQKPLFTPEYGTQPGPIPTQTTQTGWQYNAAFPTHQLEWTKGQEGKGMLYPNGSVQTWNINEYGEPHHMEMHAWRTDGIPPETINADVPFEYRTAPMFENGLLDSGHVPFIISPEGKVSHSWNEDGAIPHSQMAKIQMADFRLDPGVVKGQQYGHGFALAKEAHYERRLADIAHAYQAAPTHDREAVAAWHELAADSKRRADAVRKRLNVSVTDESEPYPDAHAMFADIDRGNFVVSRANSEHPIWTPDQNVDFRIVHDVLGHHPSGGDFSWEGENKACAAHFPLLSPHAQQALFTECIAQTAYANQFKGFGPQKTAFIHQPFGLPATGITPSSPTLSHTMPESFCHRHIRHGVYTQATTANVKMPDPPKEIWDDLTENQCVLCGNPASDDVCLDCANSAANSGKTGRLAASYAWVAKAGQGLLRSSRDQN